MWPIALSPGFFTDCTTDPWESVPESVGGSVRAEVQINGYQPRIDSGTLFERPATPTRNITVENPNVNDQQHHRVLFATPRIPVETDTSHIPTIDSGTMSTVIVTLLP